MKKVTMKQGFPSETNGFKYWCIPHMHTNLEADLERSKCFAQFTAILKTKLLAVAKLKDIDESHQSAFYVALKRPLVDFFFNKTTFLNNRC